MGLTSVLKAFFDIGLQKRFLPSDSRAFYLCDIAAQKGHESIIQLIVSRYGVDAIFSQLKFQDERVGAGAARHLIPLNIFGSALVGGEFGKGRSSKVIEQLCSLDRDAKYIASPCWNDLNPLAVAVTSNLPDCARVLIEHLPKEKILSTKVGRGRSLTTALADPKITYKPIIEALFNKGITVDELVAPVWGQKCILVSAVKQRNYLLLKFLLDQGLSPERFSRSGRGKEATPLEVAIKRDDPVALGIMLEGGAAGMLSRQQSIDIHRFAVKKKSIRSVDLIPRHIATYQ